MVSESVESAERMDIPADFFRNGATLRPDNSKIVTPPVMLPCSGSTTRVTASVKPTAFVRLPRIGMDSTCVPRFKLKAAPHGVAFDQRGAVPAFEECQDEASGAWPQPGGQGVCFVVNRSNLVICVRALSALPVMVVTMSESSPRRVPDTTFHNPLPVRRRRSTTMSRGRTEPRACWSCRSRRHTQLSRNIRDSVRVENCGSFMIR
ncbi:hypothetical protein SAMN06295998_10990 [Primorskyibacter flagellatus]|uniref:Uncharacterized protein n=1 Tax=Primorskyibacter flagellatus TaxID=1387277 RepID=A0A1W2CWA2_9RHOB|nr:hypothetical protein SAMN06295998_10990 [Primorskyibacter flagellatus]